MSEQRPDTDTDTDKSDKSDSTSVAAYIPNDLLAQKDGDRLVVSSLLTNIFLPVNRVPKAILDQMTSNRDILERQILSQIPLYQLAIEKPYWPKGRNVRDFDKVNVDIYGALCLADDRHCLDCIMAWGSLIKGAHNLTLRELAEKHIGMSVNWDLFPDQGVIDNKLSNKGVYFHVKTNTVLKAMNVATTKANRDLLLARLHRLSVMTLLLTFEKNGLKIPNRSRKLALIDRDYYPLLDMGQIKNKANIADDSYTDLIINVSSFYVQTLASEGHISRKRFMNAYKDLVGKNSVVDLYKCFDEHTREYVHGQWLSVFVARYLDEKISLYGINVSIKIRELMQEVLNMRELIHEKFNFILQAEDNPTKRIRGQDYRIYYVPKLEGRRQ